MGYLKFNSRTENTILLSGWDKGVFLYKIWRDIWLITLIRCGPEQYIKGNVIIKETDDIETIKNRILEKVGGYEGLNNNRQPKELIFKQVREYFVEIIFKGEIYYLVGNPSMDISNLVLDKERGKVKGAVPIKHIATIKNAFNLRGEPVSNIADKMLEQIRKEV
ncbi:hypothetical protein D3C81_08890 [compost metagenome]